MEHRDKQTTCGLESLEDSRKPSAEESKRMLLWFSGLFPGESIAGLNKGEMDPVFPVADLELICMEQEAAPSSREGTPGHLAFLVTPPPSHIYPWCYPVVYTQTVQLRGQQTTALQILACVF